MSATTSSFYDVEIIRNGEVIKRSTNLQNTSQITYSTATSYGTSELQFKVYSEQGITFDTFDITINRTAGSFGGGNFNTGAVSLSSDVVIVDGSPTFNPTEQLPEMKVLDFLTGLFKTFNLTAYYNGFRISSKTFK